MFCFEWFVRRLCPVFPKTLTEALVFTPPQPPTYELEIADESECKEICYNLKLLATVESLGALLVKPPDCRYVTTSLLNRIVVVHIETTSTEKQPFTILFSNGSAADIGKVYTFLTLLSTETRCDVVAYDYSGYGQSSGEPSEENMYADIAAAFEYTLTVHEPDPWKIVHFGVSLGCAAAVDLAARIPCAGVILVSPFMSTCRIVFPRKDLASCFDYMKSIDKIPLVNSPVLVVHGTKDKLVNISHAKALHESCQRPSEPLWIEGAGHCFPFNRKVWKRMCEFINQELAK